MCILHSNIQTATIKKSQLFKNVLMYALVNFFLISNSPIFVHTNDPLQCRIIHSLALHLNCDFSNLFADNAGAKLRMQT